jgi:hypothetical protein
MTLAIAGDQFQIDELVPLLSARDCRFRAGIYAQAESRKYYKDRNRIFNGAILSRPQLPGASDFVHEANARHRLDLRERDRNGNHN